MLHHRCLVPPQGELQSVRPRPREKGSDALLDSSWAARRKRGANDQPTLEQLLPDDRPQICLPDPIHQHFVIHGIMLLGPAKHAPGEQHRMPDPHRMVLYFQSIAHDMHFDKG